MLSDFSRRPYLHHRSPDAPEVIVSEPLRFVAVFGAREIASWRHGLTIPAQANREK